MGIAEGGVTKPCTQALKKTFGRKEEFWGRGSKRFNHGRKCEHITEAPFRTPPKYHIRSMLGGDS